METEVEHTFNMKSRKEMAQNQKQKKNKKNIQHKLFKANGKHMKIHQLKNCTKTMVEETLQRGKDMAENRRVRRKRTCNISCRMQRGCIQINQTTVVKKLASLMKQE